MKRVLITGGHGMLASDIADFYSSKIGFEVFAPPHNELDILDVNRANVIIFSFKPDYIFHTAALHVEDCERNPTSAFQTNSWATGELARISQRQGATLIFISTGGLFGDEVKFYSEYDPVSLKTIYARSKYNGELLASRECERLIIVRPGWLFGGSISHKKNFVFNRYLEAQKTRLIKSASDRFGSPTYTSDLIKQIDEILQGNRLGIYHISNSGGASRFEYVKEIIDCCKLDAVVEPVDSSYFPRKADVPHCEMLDNLNSKFLGFTQMPPWQDALRRYVMAMMEELNEKWARSFQL